MSEQNIPASQSHDDPESLSQEDRVWLAQRLAEYKDLLEFLRTN